MRDERLTLHDLVPKTHFMSSTYLGSETVRNTAIQVVWIGVGSTHTFCVVVCGVGPLSPRHGESSGCG
jgi:uncharacterized membrane protein